MTTNVILKKMEFPAMHTDIKTLVEENFNTAAAVTATANYSNRVRLFETTSVQQSFQK